MDHIGNLAPDCLFNYLIVLNVGRQGLALRDGSHRSALRTNHAVPSKPLTKLWDACRAWFELLLSAVSVDLWLLESTIYTGAQQTDAEATAGKEFHAACRSLSKPS